MTQEQANQLLTDDFLFYIEHAPLMVKPKSGPLVPLKLNNAQQILHAAIEDQLKRKKKVRALVLKGRQQGVSTYVGARYYHKTSRKESQSSFIITHLAEATANLFGMTLRYHDNTDERLRTPTSAQSQNKMIFQSLSSDYKIATAGSAEIGRSFTITNFHGSEFAFWPNAENIFAGALQAVPNLPDTEIILESTANGMTNDFHYMCKKAMEGKGEFELIFIPWYVQEEYRSAVPKDFELSKDEIKIKKRFELDNEQIYWRRLKINDEFKGKASKFMQEYPCTPKEAFQANDDTLIDIEHLKNAMARETVHDFDEPVILGVDPARKKDRAVIAVRQGRHFKSAIIFDCDEEELDPMELVQQIIAAIRNHKAAKCFIDSGEVGSGIVSRLREMGYGHTVVGVNFGSQATEKDTYENKRAEMWIKMAEFFHNGGCKMPDDDEVVADLLAMPDYFLNTKQKMQLISKQKIKDDYKMSTDIGDAFALTFAHPVTNTYGQKVKRTGQIEHKQKQTNKPKLRRKTVKL